MNDERYVLLEKYNENEAVLLRQISNEHHNLVDTTSGSCFLSFLAIIAGIGGCFVLGPISLVLGFVLGVLVAGWYDGRKYTKAYRGTVFEGKYKFGLLNGLKKAYEPTCAQVHAINVQKKADYDKVLRVLEKEMTKHEKSISRS